MIFSDPPKLRCPPRKARVNLKGNSMKHILFGRTATRMAIVLLSFLSFSCATAEEQLPITNNLNEVPADTLPPGTNDISEQDCSVYGTSKAASLTVEDAVISAAEKSLVTFLQIIPVGEEGKYGFRTRDELAQATVDQKAYQMHTRCKSTDYPTNVWRVPVLARMEIRAFITVEWINNDWKAVDFGAAKLAELVSPIEKAIIERQSGEDITNLHHVIIRDYQNRTDYLQINTYREEGNDYKTISAFPVVIQEQNEWCWAAVSAVLFDYFDNRVEQCEIAEYTRTVATWHNFGSENCCINPSSACNYWNYNWGYAGGIEDILESMQNRINIQNYGVGNKLTVSQIESDLSQDRPFIIRWGWDSGGGHFIVGFNKDDNINDNTDPFLHYMNPWFGEGSKIALYSWVSRGSNHTWTHTNRLTDVYMYGDIDGNNHLDMIDLILSLRLIAGSDNIAVETFADVNNDGHLGLAETIYLLGRMAE